MEEGGESFHFSWSNGYFSSPCLTCTLSPPTELYYFEEQGRKRFQKMYSLSSCSHCQRLRKLDYQRTSKFSGQLDCLKVVPVNQSGCTSTGYRMETHHRESLSFSCNYHRKQDSIQAPKTCPGVEFRWLGAFPS